MPTEVPNQELSSSALRTVPELFADAVKRCPRAIAVRHEGTVWTYEELGARVNRLARFLTARGIGRGALVPLFSPPVPDALYAMLALMHTGASYVPLDPAYPPGRIRIVLDEVDSPLVLAASGTAPDRVANAWGEVVDLGRVDLAGFSADPFTPAADQGDCVYVMYTSGSTGSPNGVEALHAGLANYLSWSANRYALGQSAGGSLVHTSIGFDLTITSLLAPLLVGQPVEFVRAGEDGLGGLARSIRERREPFSFLKLTPSHLRALRRLVDPRELVGATRCLILGGEQLYAEDLAGLEPALGREIRVFNEYGPTETVVGSTCYEIVRLPRSGSIPIGTPIDNTTVYVCDERIEPVPAGTTGELCIGGLGVARGYYKRDDLSARKFIPLPFAPQQRVYRTGDFVRRHADGALEFVGRRDHQVKVSGYRIELEEIESVLRTHQGVADAYVLADGDHNAPRLMACVLPNVSRRETRSSAGDTIRYTVSVSELHAHAAARLPEYMRPPVFVLLDSVPTNAHGKVDRRALRDLVAAGQHARAEYVPPRNDLEQALAALMATVLKADPIGIDDNYFALGGDSIRSIQLAGEALLRGIKLSVGDIHRCPTIRTLAQHLADSSREFVEMPRTSPFDLISAEDRARMPDDVEDAYPLNLLQEGMIYHRAFAAKSAVYHAMLCLSLKAPFDLAALRAVVQELVDRHPLLRTSFDQKTFSMPLQLVHRTSKDPLQFADLRGMPAEERQARLAAWVEEEKRRGFDVDEFPLIRFMVHRLGEDTFRLSFSYHHEIIDGWSESTMVSELLTHYLSIVSGEPVQMTAPKASFRDSVLLEQMALKSDAFRTFWEQTLEGASFMRLPRLLSSPKADKGERAIVKLHFPFAKETSDGIKRLALALGVPIKSVLLAGHMKVMGLFGGSSDVLTHTVSNGRPETPDGMGLIGLFVNSFTFRQRLRQGSWRELVLDTLKLEQRSIPYRRYPMAELKRHQGRDPLSETLFFLIDYHVYHRLAKWKNAQLLNYEVYGESTFPFCATFRVDHFTSELDMQIEYDSLQFPRELIEAMADAYFRVYAAMSADPMRKHQLFGLPEAHRPSRPALQAPAAHGCVHEWIEEQARRRPDAIAVVCGRAVFTYADINARANQLARWLVERGIGSETRVALFLERTSELIVSMLAVLKSGACYVPLDPDHRSDRVAAILETAAPAVVLTTGALEPLVAKAVDRRRTDVCRLDAIGSDVPRFSAGNLAVRVLPTSAAYVVFTSGSTGRPKGVVVQHASLAHSTAARLPVYGAPPERFLLLSSQAFDSSIAGLYWTLCTGATLVLPAAHRTLDLNEALKLTAEEGVTHTLCIPSLYGSMLESARPGELSSLAVVVVAGEEARTELWDQHTARVPSVAFYNEYGPSEATVWSTVWKGDPSVRRASLPIGTSIPGVTAEVLDRDGHATPTGVVGELCIGGANLARGYEADPGATAERFRPDPAGSGARLYGTGDLARLNLAAEIEYLGRADYQLKVRGFRIEPAEIEAVLETHANVNRAVVVGRTDRSGEKSLVAYVVPSKPGRLSSAEVAEFAKGKLPKYLIPSSWVVIEALPLTATGKLDRNALPAVTSTTAAERPSVAPRTPTEEAIAGIWSRVLGVDRVGVFDDFFALGGESLRAMRILSQVRKAFGVELPVATLINVEATVAALAEEVDAALWLRSETAVGAAGPGFEDAVV